MFTNFFNGIRAAAESSFGITNEDANDAVARSPAGTDLPPNLFSVDSPPASKTSRVVIDLSSPTKPSSRPSRKGSHSEMSRPRLQKSKRSEDEKRLVGDYTPADAVSIPDPKTYMPPTKRTMTTKPGSNSGFRPLDTMNTGPNAPSRKPTTYGKHNRPHPPLIGQVHGAGQVAYLQHREVRVPATPARRLSSREDHDPRSGGAMSGKRRKTDHIITLDDDDDDEVLDLSQPAHITPVGTTQDKPCSARSEQSRMSIGSGSTISDFRPSQLTSEFREADSYLRPSQKKPRKSSSNTPKGGLRHSPFGGGALSNSPGAHANRQAILQDFQQGGAKQSSLKHDSFGNEFGPVTSRFFPNARINESTSDHVESQRAKAESEDLRTQHKPAPKQAGPISDSYSADELAITPPQQGSKSPSKQRQKQAANSGVKRNARGKVLEEAWPLSFARSSYFEGNGSTSKDGRATLVLKSNKDEGFRVQIWEPVEGCYDTQIIIHPKDINKVLADGTSRIRLQGPRKHDGNSGIFDLEFANTRDFLVFLNNHASSMTLTGKYFAKPDDHMLHIFKTPLPPMNEKVGTSALVDDPTEDSKQPDRKGNGTSKTPLLDQLKRAADGPAAGAKADVTTASMGPVRPSRSRKLAPVHYVEDTPTRSDVPKYSVETGLGQPWTRSLEYGEGRQRAIVHFDDLPRLDEEEYMNDSLIDFYMIYLFKQLKVPADKVYFFNTYFFTKLTENSGRKSIDYKAVERWTSKIDIFSYDYIVVPINENQAHWYLAIICNVSNIQRKPIVQDFDEPQVSAQQHSNVSTTTTKHGAVTNQRPALSLDPPAVIEETRGQPSDEDPNLFDEAVLSLIDREDTGIKNPHASEGIQAESVRQDSEAESAAAPPVTVDAEDAHLGILSQSQLTAPSTKTKAKRKSIPKRDPDQPVVIVLDSLTGNARSGAVRALKDWIIAEGAHKRGMEAVIKENGYYPKDTQIPMQDNWTDCGVYLLGYVEKFFQNPDDFKNKLLTGSMSAQEDWPELKPSEMRHKMRQIIFDCYKQQEHDRKAQKKAKKGSASSRTSPAPTIHEPVNQSGRNTEESRNEGMKLEHSSRNGGAQPTSPQTYSPVRPPPRLASPFSLDTQRAASTEQSPQGAVSKVTDSPPVSRSPVKQAIVTLRSEETPKRHPEVRIPSRTPQSHGSTRNGQTTSDGSPRSVNALHQTGHAPGTSSPKKRRRRNDDKSHVESPTAKRQLTRSPRRIQDGNVVSDQLAPRSREGSAPSAPIEIDDSQEVKVGNANHHQHIQASSLAQRKPSSRSPRPKQTFRPSPSFEEIPRSSFSFERSKHRQREGSPIDRALMTRIDEDDYAREKARRSRAPAPSDANDSFERREEEVSDPMEGISQSTNQLQLDGVNDGSVVRETPEPDQRSLVAQNGWSRQDPLLL